MKTQQEIRDKIMRRVWGVYVVRQLTGLQARIFAFAVIVFGIASSVSISHVFSNALHVGLPGIGKFLAVAMLSTSFIVQLFVIAGIFLMIWTVRDLVARSHQTRLAV